MRTAPSNPGSPKAGCRRLAAQQRHFEHLVPVRGSRCHEETIIARVQPKLHLQEHPVRRAKGRDGPTLATADRTPQPRSSDLGKTIRPTAPTRSGRLEDRTTSTVK